MRRVLARTLVAVVALSSSAGCGFETSDGTVDDGNEALAAGKVDEAVARYGEAATRLPESPALNFDRGLAASLAGDHAAAASFLLQALATKDKSLEQKVKSALGTAYAREALALERMPPPAPDPAAAPEPEPEDGAATKEPAIPEAAMAKWKLAVDFLEDALVLDPGDFEARRTLEVALLRVDPPCATRDDRFEDNDSAEAAKAIEVKAEEPNQSVMPGAGGEQPAQASEGPKDELRFREQVFSCPDDDDWYRLELTEGDRVELAPTVPEGAGKLAFELARPDGSVAWRWTSGAVGDAAPRHRFEVGAGEAGPWRLRQTNVELDEVSYGLEVVVRPACAKVEDRYEENDGAAEAKTLTPGPVPDLKRCPGDEDWFALTLAAGESLFLFAQPDADPDEDAPAPAEGEPPPPPPFAVEIQAEGGAVLARGAPIDRALVSTLLDPGEGRYRIRVFDRDGIEPYEGRYSLQVQVVPPCPDGDDDFEDNDGPVMATDLVEASQPQQGAAQAGGPGGAPPPQQQGPPVVFARVCPGDVDWFKLVNDGKKPQVASLVFDHDKGDLSLALYDEPGENLIERADASSAEKNGEAVAIPVDEPPEPDPSNPPNPDDPKWEPAPKTFLLEVRAKPEQENFYLLRLDTPSGGGGQNQSDENDDQQDKDSEQDESDPQQSEDDQEKKNEPEDANPLQDALDNLDQNPENLPARDAARNSPLANQKPLKDW